jgi:hypothetical protein
VEKGVIPEALLCSQIDGVKELEEFLLVEETDEGFTKALLWDAEDAFSQIPMIRIQEPDHFCKRFKCGEAKITGLGEIFSLILDLFEKGDDQDRRDLFKS